MGTKMSLADFYKYSRENRKRIADIYREIEEIQYQFNDLYARQVEERRKLVSADVPLLLEHRDELPQELRRALDDQERVEREALEEEIAALKAETAEKRQKADDLIREAQRRVTKLRQQNPILDQQEEELKARRASMETQIQELDDEIQRLGITSFFKKRQLRREREQLMDNLNEIEAGIRAVRERWQEEKKALQASQTDLQNQWQALSVEVAQLQARLDHLVTNIDDESQKRAAQNWLNDLEEIPDVEGPWQERLRPVVELGRNRKQYETGLTSVAEILGLLKGLGEGMDRFLRSLATLYEEQRRYQLPALTVNLSDAVTSFHTMWPDFQSEVKDEKYLGTHPLEFNRRVSNLVQEHINAEDIQKMFDDMGQALTQATKAWR
jgi:DNA repair exonuclease SbcCD ATPase subunit